MYSESRKFVTLVSGTRHHPCVLSPEQKYLG